MNLRYAEDLLKEEAASTAQADSLWLKKIKNFSELCEAKGARTHIAFLGTALLAKATNLNVDVFAIKANKSPGAYSARNLAHNVLVPNSAILGIHLGVTGREPLNNQPYFRMERLDDGTRVHVNAKPVMEQLLAIISDLAKITSEENARSALRAFIQVRKGYMPKYSTATDGYNISHDHLLDIINKFVSEDSEHGKRAQAVAAGLLDMFAEFRVHSGRINDPSRHYPGDVAIRSIDDTAWEKVFEVRDKSVSLADVLLFGQKCLESGAVEISVIAVSNKQEKLDQAQITAWSQKYGVEIKVFYGWDELLNQILFWAPLPSSLAASKSISTIEQRLIETEISQHGHNLWQKLILPFSEKSTK